MKPTIADAVVALGFNGGFKIKEDKIAVWYRDDTQPTQSEIDTKLAELIAEYDVLAYARARKKSFPEIGDQLDDLYHKGAFSDEMSAKIKKVKDDNPKS